MRLSRQRRETTQKSVKKKQKQEVKLRNFNLPN